MTSSQTFHFDNTDGKASHLLVSSVPKIDFLRNLTRVRVYYINAENLKEIFESEYDSSTIISESDQKNYSSFYIPIGKCNYRIEIIITSTDIEGVDRIILKPKQFE